MAIPSISLNKLIILREILRHSSVSAAGRALGRAQPSVTSVLQELRIHYLDPLIVRQGNAMVLTPFAGEVLERLDVWHAETMALVDLRGTFDPASAIRDFRIRTSDYQHTILAPKVVAALAGRKGLTATFIPASGDMTNDVADMALDLAAHTGGKVPDEFSCGSFHTDRFVIFYDPAITKPPATIEAFCKSDFVLAVPTGKGNGPVDAWLAANGHSRHIRYRTQQIVSAARMIPGTPLLTVLPAALATEAKGMGLSDAPLPFDIPPIKTSLAWPKRLNEDIGHRWLRDALLA